MVGARPYARSGRDGGRPQPASLLGHVVAFSLALRDAGVKVNPAGLTDLCRSLEFIDIADRTAFYAAARASLVSRSEDLPRFDRIFREYWHAEVSPEPRPAPPEREEEGAQRDPAGGGSRKQEAREDGGGDGDTARHGEAEAVSYSDRAVLMQKDIGTMSAAELEQARQALQELVQVLASYRSRRFQPGKARDVLDFRRMFRRNAIYGGTPMQLLFRRRREKKTRLVLLCDVSGSMERYSRFLIQFIVALRQVLPLVDIGVFSTRLTMITELIEKRNIDASLQRVRAQVRDWGSGTDIGGSLREFNRAYARRIVRSRTLLIILSDGWDRGDADVLRQQIEDLHRRVHKLIWLNPLLGSRDYLPLCRGIRTALPFMDHFLPAHNLASLKLLSRTLQAAWH